MANRQLTGWTEEQKLEARAEHPSDHRCDFHDFYCLAEIQNQPDEYGGPTRFCKKNTLKKEAEGERYNRCRKHNGAGHNDWQSGLDEADGASEGNVRAMKHGMYAEDANLKDNWDEADEKLYEKVMGWAEDYGFEEGSPEYQQLESLAMSKVRAMRGEVYLNENGEVVTRESFNPETGEKETWEEVHPLSDNVRLKKQTIIKMMKELGLTPKARSTMDESEAKASEASAMAEIASEALDGEENEYDPSQFED